MRNFTCCSTWVGAYKLIHTHACQRNHLYLSFCSKYPVSNINSVNFSATSCICSFKGLNFLAFRNYPHIMSKVIAWLMKTFTSIYHNSILQLIVQLYSWFQDKWGAEISWKTQLMHYWGETAEWPLYKANILTVWLAMCWSYWSNADFCWSDRSPGLFAHPVHPSVLLFIAADFQKPTDWGNVAWVARVGGMSVWVWLVLLAADGYCPCKTQPGPMQSYSNAFAAHIDVSLCDWIQQELISWALLQGLSWLVLCV